MAPRRGGGHKGNKKRRRAKIRAGFKKRGPAPSRRPSNTIGSSKEARIARNKWNTRQKAGLHPTKTGMMRVPTSLRRVTSHLANQFNKGWGKNLSQSAKNRISNFAKSFPTTTVKVGIKTGVKAKIGEPNYKPGSGSSPDFLPEDNEYLAAMVKYNPLGSTIKEKEKAYKKYLDKGWTLQQAMEWNPSEYTPHWALFEDEPNTPTTNNSTNNKMAFDWSKYGVTDARTGGSTADIKHNIDRLYQNVVGRNADPGGSDYWAKHIGSGANDYSTLISGLTGSKEYTDRLAAVTADPNITEQKLDALPSAYISPFNANSGSAVAGWQPGDPLTQATADAVSTGGSSSSNYADQVNKTPGGDDGDSTTPAPASWWSQYADLDAFKKALGTNQSGGMDDFMKFMMLMSVMRPGGGFGGGGYGGSQYGYGGLNPGGVQAAYNPWENIQSAVTAFKTLPGIGTGTINTGTPGGGT